MTRRTASVLLRLSLGAGLLGALTLGNTSAVSAAKAEPAGPPSICFSERDDATTTPAPTPTNAVSVSVTVSVAETTRMHINDSGAVTSVGTNSGCAPRAADDFIVEHGDSYTLATDAQIVAALACRTTGSWDDTTRMHNCH